MALRVVNPALAPRQAIAGVLFDLDGLVLDTEKLYSRFWREACQHFGFPMTYPQSLAMRALGGEAGQGMLQSFFGPGADYAAIRQERIARMDAFVAREGVAVKPGIRPLLQELRRRGIATAITSASPMGRIESYLGKTDLLPLFDRLCSGHDVPRSKPAPDIYLRGAASLGLPPESCLALEDAWPGLQSAREAGCVPILIPDLDGPEERTLALVYAVAEGPEDVLCLLPGSPVAAVTNIPKLSR